MIRVEMIKTTSYVNFLLPMYSFLKEYNIRMKTVKRLSIQDKPGYFFMNMTNINDFDSELLANDDFAVFKDGSVMYDIVLL